MVGLALAHALLVWHWHRFLDGYAICYRHWHALRFRHALTDSERDAVRQRHGIGNRHWLRHWHALLDRHALWDSLGLSYCFLLWHPIPNVDPLIQRDSIDFRHSIGLQYTNKQQVAHGECDAIAISYPFGVYHTFRHEHAISEPHALEQRHTVKQHHSLRHYEHFPYTYAFHKCVVLELWHIFSHRHTVRQCHPVCKCDTFHHGHIFFYEYSI
jgi:hypothetical protein